MSEQNTPVLVDIYQVCIETLALRVRQLEGLAFIQGNHQNTYKARTQKLVEEGDEASEKLRVATARIGTLEFSLDLDRQKSKKLLVACEVAERILSQIGPNDLKPALDTLRAAIADVKKERGGNHAR